MGWMVWFLNSSGCKKFSLLHTCPDQPWAYPALFLFPRGRLGQGIELTIHFQLVLKFIVGRAITVLPLFASNGMSWGDVKTKIKYISQTQLCLINGTTMLHVSVPKELSSGNSYKTIYTPVLLLVKVFYELLDNDSLGTETCSIVVPFVKQSYVWLMCCIFVLWTLQHYGITPKKCMGWPLPLPVLEVPWAFFSLCFVNHSGMLTHLGIMTLFKLYSSLNVVRIKR